MIRYYCDDCGKEIDDPQTKFTFTQGPITVEITRAVNGTWNAGQVCLLCILLVISNEATKHPDA